MLTYIVRVVVACCSGRLSRW